MAMFPVSKFAKWAMWLTLLSLVVSILFFIFMFKGQITFSSVWWDLTVAFIAPIEVIALILGIHSIMKDNEHSLSTYIAIGLGIAVVLFLLTHSFFI